MLLAAGLALLATGCVETALRDVREPFFPDPEGVTRVRLEAGLIVGRRPG